MKSTGNRIQDRRESAGLSRGELAEKLGMTRLRVWRIETGKIQVDADDLPKIAKALRTTVAELFA